MAEGAVRSLGRNEPGRIRRPARRERRPFALAVMAGCGAIAGLAATLMWKPAVLLVWNASASAPLGLYRVETKAGVHRGDMVVAWAPRAARTLAAQRRYLPANVPLVKRIAAVEGDRVCASGRSILINRRRAAERRPADPAGRPLPWWTGCRRLGRGETFLLMDSPASFDGRYFGITRKQQLVGRAVLIWAEPVGGAGHD